MVVFMYLLCETLCTYVIPPVHSCRHLPGAEQWVALAASQPTPGSRQYKVSGPCGEKGRSPPSSP